MDSPEVTLDNQNLASLITSRSLIQCRPIGICSGGLKECLSGDLCPLVLKRTSVSSFCGLCGAIRLDGKHEDRNPQLGAKKTTAYTTFVDSAGVSNFVEDIYTIQCHYAGCVWERLPLVGFSRVLLY